MSMLHTLLSSTTSRAGLATGAIAAAQQTVHEAAQGTIQVGPAIYYGLSVLLALAGVFLARLVTINDEEKALGRRPSFSETGPLTWIGVLIVCPLIWHYEVAVPWAGIIGLGVGYSVKVLLKIFGDGAVDAARAMARRAAGTLDDQRPDPALPPAPPPTAPVRPEAIVLPPDHEGPDGPARQRLLNRLDQMPPPES